MHMGVIGASDWDEMGWAWFASSSVPQVFTAASPKPYIFNYPIRKFIGAAHTAAGTNGTL